jgi:hypothetical protein
MAEFKKLLLLDIYPQSDFKDALILMVNYVIERKNNSILSFYEERISAIDFFNNFTTACNLLCLESSIVIETLYNNFESNQLTSRKKK